MKIIAAARLVRELMNRHGMMQVPFKWNRAKVSVGQCHWKRNRFDHNKIECAAISLSIYYVRLNDEAEIRETILHEIAHCLAGYGHNHDYYWRRIAIRIGSSGEVCYDDDKVKMPEGRYKAECECGYVDHMHRAGKHVRQGNYYCPRCEKRLNFVDTQTQTPVSAW